MRAGAPRSTSRRTTHVTPAEPHQLAAASPRRRRWVAPARLGGMLEWLVLADDRTGALEVAGEVARSLGPVTVTVNSVPTGAAVAVVDLESRHCAPPEAA